MDFADKEQAFLYCDHANRTATLSLLPRQWNVDTSVFDLGLRLTWWRGPVCHLWYVDQYVTACKERR